VRALGIAIVVAVACRGGGDDKARAPGGSGGAVVAGSGSAADPWSAPPKSDVPTLLERKAFVDKACPSVTGPYFFKLEKAGKASYILGTRHVSVALAEFPPVVRERLRASHLAVFEIDPNEDRSSKPRPENRASLKDQVGPELWKKFVALVGEASAAEVEHGKPNEAVLEMMVLYEDPTRLLESDIERDVAELKIPTKGLETSTFQDDLLDKLIDLRMLRAALANTADRKEFADETTRDLRDYCTGTGKDPGVDPKTRKELLAAGYTAGDIAAIDDQLVYSRNRDWIPKLDALFAAGDVFVAVGADHLLGDRGVIELLAARGYKATRITK
jgi:uncharacterized protein YbaP (TraB family)